jgi:hypothetical protein
MYMFIQFKENAVREFRGGKVNPSGRLSVRRTPCLQCECTLSECGDDEMRSPTPEPAVLGYASESRAERAVLLARRRLESAPWSRGGNRQHALGRQWKIPFSASSTFYVRRQEQ